jgi:molybdenum cofactor synthesis domain-containing protein
MLRVAPESAEHLVPLEEARRRVLASCCRLASRDVPLADALGSVLASAVYSPEPVPAFANSAMDGYALRAADVRSIPAQLKVIGAVMAGDPPEKIEVGPGEAARIMTGAPMPAGADAVVMVEHTSAHGELVVVEEAVLPGNHVRPAGSDLVAGEEVLPAGVTLCAPQIAVLAAAGAQTVAVYPRPVVGVASTGDELHQGPGSLPPGKVRDSNRPGLLAQLRADGFEPLDLGKLPDDKSALAEALFAAAQRCDAVLTSGGVSMGERDLVKVVLDELGRGTAMWLKVAVRPAKPLAFAVLALGNAMGQAPGSVGGGSPLASGTTAPAAAEARPAPAAGLGAAVPVFGLPGNPVSAFVSYELFARPALRLMAGHSRLGRPELRAVLEEPLPRKRDGKLHLARVALERGPDGRPRVRLAGGQGSHQLSAFARSAALALVPDGNGLAAGDEVDVWLLDEAALAGGERWVP